MLEPTNAIKLTEGNGLTDNSWEIARLWVTHNEGSSVWIAPWALDGAQNFGHLMVDTILHGASAYARQTGEPEGEALKAILGSIIGDLGAEIAKLDIPTPRDAG